MKNKLYLAHLYPDYLNFYGDNHNPTFLQNRAADFGIEITIDHLTIGDPFDPKKYDLIFLGGGQDRSQREIYPDLIKLKGDPIRTAIEDGVVTLAICGGYQLMGHYYLDLEGYRIKGLGILDMQTIAEPDKLMGDLVFEADLPLQDNVLCGIEEHSGRTFLGKDVRALGKVRQGFGNNGKDQTEGAQYKNLFGTYGHGSFLPSNPQMADYLLELAAGRKGFVLNRERKV